MNRINISISKLTSLVLAVSALSCSRSIAQTPPSQVTAPQQVQAPADVQSVNTPDSNPTLQPTSTPDPLPVIQDLPKIAPAAVTPQPDLSANVNTASTDDSTSPGMDTSSLEKMLGPIALFPDDVIALILPASTYPTDIAVASQFLEQGGDPKYAVDAGWDESITELMKFPTILKKMADNVAGTTRLGTAFLTDPDLILQTIQDLRARAEKSGALVDNEQQKVTTTNNIIQIQPTDPETVYIPVYQPSQVYAPPAYAYPDTDMVYSDYYPSSYTYGPGYISYGSGYYVGRNWGHHYLDWDDGDIDIDHNHNWNNGDHNGFRPGGGGSGEKWHHDGSRPGAIGGGGLDGAFTNNNGWSGGNGTGRPVTLPGQAGGANGPFDGSNLPNAGSKLPNSGEKIPSSSEIKSRLSNSGTTGNKLPGASSGNISSKVPKAPSLASPSGAKRSALSGSGSRATTNHYQNRGASSRRPSNSRVSRPSYKRSSSARSSSSNRSSVHRSAPTAQRSMPSRSGGGRRR